MGRDGDAVKKQEDRESRCKIQDAGVRIQDARCTIQDAKRSLLSAETVN